jgi:hypothetical protein
VEQLAQRAATRLLDADGHEVLRADVGVDEAQVRVEDDEAGGQCVQQIGGIEVRQRR